MYPALAVLQALKPVVDNAYSQFPFDTLWVGGKDGMEVGIVGRAGVTFEGISAAGVHGVGWRALPGNALQLGRGYLQSRKILSQVQPDVMFFTGGYTAVPMAFAGRAIPSAVFVPDIEPGMALNTVSRYADRIALSVDDSRKYFPDHPGLHVTGYPVRPELLTWERPQALEALNLDEELPVLFVFGGSKGARSINRALLPVLGELLEEMQVLHISGTLDWDEVKAARQELPSHIRVRYQAYPYLHDRMGAALRAADLVLSRAGASALGEFPAFGVPAILVPYPYAWRYQQVNATYLTERGAAVMVEDADLPSEISNQVLGLMRDRDRLGEMRKAMSALAQPDAAKNLAHILLSLAGYRAGKDVNE